MPGIIDNLFLGALAIAFAAGFWWAWRDTKEFGTSFLAGMLASMAASAVALLIGGVVWAFQNL